MVVVDKDGEFEINSRVCCPTAGKDMFEKCLDEHFAQPYQLVGFLVFSPTCSPLFRKELVHIEFQGNNLSLRIRPNSGLVDVAKICFNTLRPIDELCIPMTSDPSILI